MLIQTPIFDGDYQKFLANIKDGQNVYVQEFCPHNHIEYWRFTPAQISGDRVFIYRGYRDEKFWDRSTGMLCSSDSSSEWGEVFPARIIPAYMHLAGGVPQLVTGDRPYYEPCYLGAYRHVFLYQYPSIYGPQAKWGLMKDYRYYRRGVVGGELVNVFTHEDESSLYGLHFLKYLYSEFLSK